METPMSDVFRQFAKYLIITYSHLMHYRLLWFSARARVLKIIGPLSRVFRPHTSLLFQHGA